MSDPEQEISNRFAELQRKLVPLWEAVGSAKPPPHTIVVIPSLSYDSSVLGRLEGLQQYEERFLILLMLLRNPSARLIYVTSEPIMLNVVDYYLHLLPGVIPSQARPRLSLISALDGTMRPLTEKILERPRLIERIRSLVGDPDSAYLIVFNATRLERELALKLGVPIFGADPKFNHLGSKSGCRRLFAEEAVPHPAGYLDLHSMEEVVESIAKLRKQKPDLREVIVKTNHGVSGFGNARIDLQGLPEPGAPDESECVSKRIDLELEDGFHGLLAKQLVQEGGVVEELIDGPEVRSPSAQMLITPAGEVQMLSTHDQLLGGPDGQVYQGCKFPADSEYAVRITEEAEKIGRRLAKEGVVGRAAIDFVAIRSSNGWDPYAIELNLRQGGTTHPFLTLQFLTDGRYVPEAAAFIAPNGRRKFFVASDHVESPLYRGFTPDDLFDIVVRHKLHFDHAQQTGVVFHMVSSLPEIGRTGLTAVADSPEEAQWMYDGVVRVLDEEAKDSFEERIPYGEESG
jgi:pheganomycin biosynthesis PGM1-like protein/ATP-grasp domain-containing protein